MKNRYWPPLWDHDAYPLRALTQRLEPIIAKLSGSRTGGAVADLGCGDSPYQPLLERHAFRYITCDLPGGNAEVVLRVNEPVPLASSSTAGVVSFQVLEHVWNLQWYLTEAHRILKDDGFLVLSTHGAWPYHPHPDDFRRWTRPGLIKELESRGFAVDEAHSLVGPLAWTLLFQFMALGMLLRKIPLLGRCVAGTLAFVTNPLLGLADKITPPEWVAHNAAIYLIVARKSPT